MSRIVLFGTTDFEIRLTNLIENQSEHVIVAYCVDAAYKRSASFNGRPVISLEELPAHYPPFSHLVLVGIGYKSMNSLRREKYVQLSEMGYNSYNFISKAAYVDESCQMGSGNIILGNAYIDTDCIIGNSNIIECGVQISHGCKIGCYNYLSPSTCIGGKVIIGNQCFFGLNSTIRSAVEIHDCCLIGASAYADRDVPTEGVIVPSRSHLLDKKSGDISILVSGDKEWEEYK